MRGEREQLRKVIEPDLLTRFDRIAAQRGTGIARAENQQCMGCRMGVRPQVWNQLARRRVADLRQLRAAAVLGSGNGARTEDATA